MKIRLRWLCSHLPLNATNTIHCYTYLMCSSPLFSLTGWGGESFAYLCSASHVFYTLFPILLDYYLFERARGQPSFYILGAQVSSYQAESSTPRESNCHGDRITIFNGLESACIILNQWNTSEGATLTQTDSTGLRKS